MKFAVVDLECTDLKGDRGFLLCAGILPLGGKPRVISLRDTGFGSSRLKLDAPLALAVRDAIEEFDGVVGWNSALFDWGFLSDRLLLAGARKISPRFHIDIMYAARMGKSTFTSSRLDWVARALGCPFKKTSLDMSCWKEAEAEAILHFRRGHKAFDYIVDHCREDLKVTEWVFERLKGRVQTISKR